MKSYSTDQPANSDMEKAWKDMIGKKVYFKSNNRGQVTEVKGDPMKMDEAMYTDPNYTRFDYLKELMNMDAFYPSVSVGKGSSWKFNSSMKHMYPMRVKNKCVLSEVNGEEVKVSLNGKVAPNKLQIGQSEGGTVMLMDLIGTRTGWYNVKKSSGFVNASECTYKLSGTVRELSDDGDNKNPMTFKIEINFKDTYSFK
jgi:hypothetical protein